MRLEYKRILKSRNLRLKILEILDFIPDETMIRIQYKIKTGRKIDLKKPARYSEKVQWYKLKYRDPLMIQCADKYGVREYVKSKGLEKILIPLYGVYKNAEDINFDTLPNKFVLKTTNGSHTNIFCEDKSKFNRNEAVEKLNTWLKSKRIKAGREWAYYNIEPKIICEAYLEKDRTGDLPDYKFYCFNGEVFCLYVCSERNINGDTKISIFDRDFNKMPVKRKNIDEVSLNIRKPENFETMIRYAEILSSDFPHVRVDLYNKDGFIYFGELTFYSASGYIEFEPDNFDFVLGEKFKLPGEKY